MRPLLVVVLPPLLDPGPCISRGQEPRGVQALRPQARIERLDKGVVRRFARSGEIDLHLVQVRPVIQQTPCELQPVVHPQAPRLTPQAYQLVQHLHHLGRPEVGSRCGREPLSCVDVHDGQDPDGSAVEQLVRHEVLGPDLVGSLCPRTSLAVAPGPLAPRQLGPDRQAFLGVEPVDPLVVHNPSFPPQQHVQAPVAVAHPHRGQVLQPHPQRRLGIAPGPVAL